MRQPPRKFTVPAMAVFLGAALFGGIAIGSSMPRDEHVRTVVVHATATPTATTFVEYLSPCKGRQEKPDRQGVHLVWRCENGNGYAVRFDR